MGRVQQLKREGKPLPPNAAVDKDGQPTTDGSLYPYQASLAPMAGHKGYGFGLWCEILSGILPGGRITWEIGSWMFDDTSQPSRHNASFIAIDIAAMIPREQFQQRLRKLIDEIHGAKTADGIERVLLPGEREGILLRRAQTEGIALPLDVIAKLEVVAKEFDVELSL